MKKFKALLIIIVLAVFVGALSACGSGVKDDSQLRAEGYFCVTFDSCGGKIGTLEIKTMYFKPEALLLEPGVHNSFDESKRSGYYFEGWYTGSKDEAGVVFYDELWDFDNGRMTAEDFTLYAKWSKSFYINYLYGFDGTEFKNNQIKDVTKEDYGVDAKELPTSPSGVTFVECYYDSDLTQIVDFPLSHPRNDGEHELKLYIKEIEGDYTLVREAKDLNRMDANTNYYLLNDIYFDGITWIPPARFAGVLNGNNKKILNLNYSATQSRDIAYYGIFTYLDDAQIKDITFENCSISVDLGVVGTYGCYIGLLAGSVENVKLQNVNYVGCTVSATGQTDNISATGKIAGREQGTNVGITVPTNDQILINIV